MIEFTEYRIQRGFERIQKLVEIVGDRGYIAGSYAAHMAAYNGDHIIAPNDIDIFAVSDVDAEGIIRDLKLGGMIVDKHNAIAVTLSAHKSTENPICDMDIQIIKPNPNWQTDQQGFRDDLLNSFDFNVCRAFLDGDKIIGDIEIGSQTGRVLRVANPVRTMKRIMKYRDRGVEFSDWELCKVFLAFGELSDERLKEITDSAQPQPADDYDEHYEWYDDDDYFNAE
jgi:hypothetical protein